MFKLKHALALFIITLGVFVFSNSSAHAASFTVAAGNDENTDNSSCSLTEAIENINDQATTNTDCSPTGAYGTDDTINLPAETITLTATLSQITESITIVGQGMDVSIIDGDGTHGAFSASNETGTFEFRGFTVTAYTNNSAIYTESGNVILDQIEIDGAGYNTGGGAVGAISLTNVSGSTANVVTISNIYVHGFNYATLAMNLLTIGTGGLVGTSFTADNITITDSINTQAGGNFNPILLGVALFGGSTGEYGVTGTASNVTLSDLESDLFSGFGVIGVANGVDNTSSEVTLLNSTISNVRMNVGGTPVLAGGAGFQSGDIGSASLTVQNLLLADIGSLGVCATQDITSVFGGQGTGTGTITSNGGNLSDDGICSSYFTQPTDQNNVTGLASSLGNLGDYGGYVPTIPLLEGSPAIDAGVPVAGLTTDARGVSRPLGLAYDSGAYESPFVRATSTETLANTGESVRALLAAAGAFLTGSLFVTWRRRVLQ